jgi:hypothetical protein
MMPIWLEGSNSIGFIEHDRRLGVSKNEDYSKKHGNF